jgi:hypothetical protein
MGRPASTALSVALVVLVMCSGLTWAQEGNKSGRPTVSPASADQFDAKDQRKLERLRKLEELRTELASSGQLGPEAFQRMEASLTAFLDAPQSDDLPRYDLLLQLGDLHMRRNQKGSKLNAIHYLHLAAIENPGRVDAYLRLAQLYSDLGESQEQLKYLHVAHDIVASSGRYSRLAEISRRQGDAPKFTHYTNQAKRAPKSFDFWYMFAQYYLERGNHYAALTSLRPVAFDRTSYYRDDPYLINQMYHAASMDVNTFHYWAPALFATKEGISLLQLQKALDKKFATFRDEEIPKKIVAYMLSEGLMSFLRNSLDVTGQHEVDDPVTGKPVFRLKPISIGWGSPKSPLKFDRDLGELLPELFIRASVSPSPTDTPEQQRQKEEQLKQLKQRIADLKQTAEAQFGQIRDPEKKARALFMWLKQEVLRDYALVEGIPAENVLDPAKKKYLCLTGAIMYTFLGRHLGLDVVGCLAPGHAYCRFNNGGRSIIVETTENEGFDIPESKLYEGAGKHGGILFPERPDGPVSPWELVSCQFQNVASVQPRLLIYENPKYRELALQALEKFPEAMMNDIKKVRVAFERSQRGDDKYTWQGAFTAKDCLDTWYLTPLGSVSRIGMDMGDLIELYLVQQMVKLDPAFHRDVLARYQEGLEVLARALQMEPFRDQFRRLYVNQLKEAEQVDIGVQKSKMEAVATKLSSKKDPSFDDVADAAREVLQLGNPLVSSLERRKDAMRYCPPIPELKQEYLRLANTLYRHLAEVEGRVDKLARIPGAPPELTRVKNEVVVLREKAGTLTAGID